MAYARNSTFGEEKLFYFSGKVRAFWKDKIFFLDQRNAAIIGFHELYINGQRASQTDLHSLDAMVANSDWDMAPVLHSYVVKYRSGNVPPWPYKLKGKILWYAHFAWIGPMPKAVELQIEKRNVVYMPITYYTGQLISVFGDKFLFGDSRNNVLVHSCDFSVYGQYISSRDAMIDLEHRAPLVHAFIINLDFLTSKSYEGPELHVPTWPVDSYGASTWVAKFAWVGEMPFEFRQQLSRFQVIKINEWNSVNSFGGNVRRPLSMLGNGSQGEFFSVTKGAKGKGNRMEILAEPLLGTTQKEAAIVKGTVLVANHDNGLMNSCLDVIAFSVKNFYVNGEIFRGGKPLDKFFQDRNVPLTAWIIPLEEPVLIFDIYVMWRAVCVWYGIPPKNMEYIKNRYDNGILSGSVPQALNTTSDNRYTLVLGRIVHTTYNYGYATAEIGSTAIEITFKRKAVYMKGYKLHTKCNLMEVKDELETGIWTFLVYPVMGNNSSNVMYTALALWQYQFQHFVSSDLLYRILLEGRNVALDDLPSPEGAESSDKSEDDNMGRHMTGMVVKRTPQYGIIETRSITIEPSYVFFLRSNFYVDGVLADVPMMMNHLDTTRQVNLFARSTKYQDIKGYPVTMYATLLWMGKKSLDTRKYSPELPEESSLQDKSVIGDSAEKMSEIQDYNSLDDLASGDENFQKAAEMTKPSSPELEHRYGRFVHLKDRYGVIRCGFKDKGYTYALFDFSIVWVSRDRLEPSENLDDNIIQDEVQCNLLAYKIPEVKVGSFNVTMQASAVWLGARPVHIDLPEVKSPLKYLESISEQVESKPEAKWKSLKEYVISNGDKVDKSGNECKEISSKLSDIKLTDVKTAAFVSLDNKAVAAVSSDNKIYTPVSLEDVAQSLRKPYAGKHVTGRILKLMKGCGIAMWRCAAKEGEVFMFFFKKNIYVNLCPMDESYVLDKATTFNFYVVPVLHRTLEGYKTSLYATCGWKGSKPRDIPAPGEQDHAQVSLDSIYALEVNIGRTVPGYIVKISGNKGVAMWRSPAHGGDIFIEFEKNVTCENIKAIFDNGIDSEDKRPCSFHVKPMEQKELGGYIVSLTAMYGWLGKKPSHMPKPKSKHQPTLLGQRLHAIPSPPNILETAAAMAVGDTWDSSKVKPKEEGISALDVVDVDSKNLEIKEDQKKKNKLELWEDESAEISLKGKIVELYSNNGRLEGCDGKQHFFSRENSYLFGVCLNNVELWHVLVQGESVSYKLSEMSAGESKVSKMWVGPECLPADVATKHINEWCDKHLVPDGAKELLVHQIELSHLTPGREREES